MSLAKTAQHLTTPIELDKGLLYKTDDSLNVSDEDDDNKEEHEHKHHHEEEPHMHGKGEIVLVIDEPEHEPIEEECVFTLPLVPGGEIQEEIEEEDENELAVEEEDDEVKVEEPEAWDWQARGVGNFVSWLKGMLNNVPRHDGVSSTGIERAISYLESLNRIISKAVRSDLKDELDVSAVENMRDEIHKGIVRLEERLEKINSNKYKKPSKKKRADEDQDGLVKEAQKIAGIGKIVITVPLLISHIVRVCINGTVSAGKDMEDTFKKLAEKYKLTPRERVEAIQLLEDYGWPLRHREVNFDEDFDPTSGNNIEYIQQFNG